MQRDQSRKEEDQRHDARDAVADVRAEGQQHAPEEQEGSGEEPDEPKGDAMTNPVGAVWRASPQCRVAECAEAVHHMSQVTVGA